MISKIIKVLQGIFLGISSKYIWGFQLSLKLFAFESRSTSVIAKKTSKSYNLLSVSC